MNTQPTQKEIVKVLDRAAGRSQNPATPKQTWFLAGLIFQSGGDADEFTLSGQSLSKRMASELIEVELAALNTRRTIAA